VRSLSRGLLLFLLIWGQSRAMLVDLRSEEAVGVEGIDFTLILPVDVIKIVASCLDFSSRRKMSLACRCCYNAAEILEFYIANCSDNQLARLMDNAVALIETGGSFRTHMHLINKIVNIIYELIKSDVAISVATRKKIILFFKKLVERNCAFEQAKMVALIHSIGIDDNAIRCDGLNLLNDLVKRDYAEDEAIEAIDGNEKIPSTIVQAARLMLLESLVRCARDRSKRTNASPEESRHEARWAVVLEEELNRQRLVECIRRCSLVDG